MKALVYSAIATVCVLLGGAFGLVFLVVIASGGAGTATAAVTATNPSPQAVADIPAVMLGLFVDEAQQCPGLPWTVMAGISKVESDHGRFGGSTLGIDGVVRPPIIGIALDGTNGTARIRDTDNGQWDRDRVWDRAVGPFQFIPSSWRIFGSDGNGDGIADPHNVYDAVGAMRRHLCPDGQIVNIEAAVYSYNRSNEYGRLVLEWAAKYTGPLTAAATPVAGYALPLTGLDSSILTRPHHDYPAWDAPVPVGTPVFAMVAGTITTATTAGIYPTDPKRCGTTVIVEGIDGARYTYCHLTALLVAPGQVVGAGALLGLSGGEPGTPGAGNTTGPHLHLGIRFSGAAICPQPLLLAIHKARPINPAIAPAAGCVQGRPTTNWDQWLDQIAPVPENEQGDDE